MRRWEEMLFKVWGYNKPLWQIQEPQAEEQFREGLTQNKWRQQMLSPVLVYQHSSSFIRLLYCIERTNLDNNSPTTSRFQSLWPTESEHETVLVLISRLFYTLYYSCCFNFGHELFCIDSSGPPSKVNASLIARRRRSGARVTSTRKVFHNFSSILLIVANFAICVNIEVNFCSSRLTSPLKIKGILQERHSWLNWLYVCHSRTSLWL